MFTCTFIYATIPGQRPIKDGGGLGGGRTIVQGCRMLARQGKGEKKRSTAVGRTEWNSRGYREAAFRITCRLSGGRAGQNSQMQAGVSQREVWWLACGLGGRAENRAEKGGAGA